MATVHEHDTPFIRGAKPPHLNADTPPHQTAKSGATTTLTSLSAKTSPWGGSHNISGYAPTPFSAQISTHGGGLSTPLHATMQQITTPHSTGGIRKYTGLDTSVIPRPETPTQHPEQLCPPPQAFELAHKVYQRPSREWRMEDFVTPTLSVGTSVLASLLVDYIATTVCPQISESMCCTLARLAVVTAPRRLLSLLQNQQLAKEYTEWVLNSSTETPPTIERLLCPRLTPTLIQNEHMRARTDSSLLRGDRISIINFFIQCFYPSAAGPSLSKVLQSYSDSELAALMNTPGHLCSTMRLRNRVMEFSPPQWYRLSINPSNPPPPTAFTNVTTTQFCTSPESVTPERAMKLTMDELRGLPFPQQRTAFLSALPKLLEDIAPEALNEAFIKVNGASAQELLSYTNIDMFIDTFIPNTSGVATAQVEIDSPPLYVHNLSIKHTAPSRRGGPLHWNAHPEDIYKLWIEAAYPLLASKQHRLFIIHSPFDRILDDKEITGDTDIPATTLQFYTYNIKSPKRLSSFDVWIKTTHPNITELTTQSKMGSGVTTYINQVSNASIWVETLLSAQLGVLPCVMLGNSIDRDSDNIILHELADRFTQNNINLDPDIYYSTTCVVSNAANRASVSVKCIMSRKEHMTEVQSAFMTLREKTSVSTHLVTRDYMFENINYYSDEKADKSLTDAIIRQQEFMATITKTILRGFSSIDPFHYVPTHTRDIRTSEIIPNTRTLAALILNGSNSPVIRVSTNDDGSRVYLTGYKQDANQLIQYTGDVLADMQVWIDPPLALTCAIDEAKNHASNLGSTLTTASTSSTGTRTAPHGAQQQSVTLSHTVDTSSTTDSQASSTQQIPSTSTFQEDLNQFKSSIEQQLHSLTNRVTATPTLTEDLLGNISTLVETNLNSSLSSMSETAKVSIATFMEEQKNTITTFLTSQESQIQNILTKLAEGEETTRGLRETLQTYEATFRKQTEVIMKLTEQNKQMQLAVEASNMQLQRMMEETPQPGGARASIWPPPTTTTATTTFTAPQPTMTPQVAGLPKTFWTSILPSSSPPTALKDISPLPPPRTSEQAALSRKAQGVISLLKSMPQTQASKAAEKLEASGTEEGEIVFSKDPDPDSDSHAAATMPTCHFCAEAGIGLMYCDRCVDPVDLFHESCLVWVREARERVCMKCLKQPTNLTQPTVTNPTPPKNLKQPSEYAPTAAASDSETETIASPSSATTNTSDESYSHTIQKIFSKPSKSKLLKKLKEANPSQPDTAPLISPRKTRSKSRTSQTSKKKPQDAYDTPEEDEE